MIRAFAAATHSAAAQTGSFRVGQRLDYARPVGDQGVANRKCLHSHGSGLWTHIQLL